MREIENEELIERTTREFLDKLGTTGEVSVKYTNGCYSVDIKTKGFDPLLIGKGGKTLDALEYLIGLILRVKRSSIRIKLDVAGYRKRKRQLIINKAKAVIKRVRETKREMPLEPLYPDEMEVVKEYIKDIEGITSYEVRKGDVLIFVIAPAT